MKKVLNFDGFKSVRESEETLPYELMGKLYEPLISLVGYNFGPIVKIYRNGRQGVDINIKLGRFLKNMEIPEKEIEMVIDNAKNIEMNKNYDILSFFRILFPYKSEIELKKMKGCREMKRIYSEIDPYGEEHWED
jgi:hypothetical protein